MDEMRWLNEHGRIWSINTGGLPGLWRLIGVLEGLKIGERPEIIATQEIYCNSYESMNTINRLDFLGYNIYASESVLRGAMTRGGVTLIKHSVGSCFVHEFQKEGSSILATAVGSL